MALTFGCHTFISKYAPTEQNTASTAIKPNDAHEAPAVTNIPTSGAISAEIGKNNTAIPAHIRNVTGVPRFSRYFGFSNVRICIVKNNAATNVSNSPRPIRKSPGRTPDRIAPPAITSAVATTVRPSGARRSRKHATSGRITQYACVRNADVEAAVCANPSACNAIPSPPQSASQSPCRSSSRVGPPLRQANGTKISAPIPNRAT